MEERVMNVHERLLAGDGKLGKIKLKEDIDHPQRYGGDTVYECIKVLKAWFPEEEYRGFLRCNAVKYLCRAGKKDDAIKDLKKAEWYVHKLIEELEADKPAK